MKTKSLFRYIFFFCFVLTLASCPRSGDKTKGDGGSQTRQGERQRETPCKDIEDMYDRLQHAPDQIKYDHVYKMKRSNLDRLLYPDTTGSIYAIISTKNNKLDITFDTAFSGHPDSAAFAGKTFPFGLNDFPQAIKMEKTELLQLERDTDCDFFLFLPGIDTTWEDGLPQNCNSRHFTLSVLGSDKGGGGSIHPGHNCNGKTNFAVIMGRETWPRSSFSWLSGKLSCD